VCNPAPAFSPYRSTAEPLHRDTDIIAYIVGIAGYAINNKRGSLLPANDSPLYDPEPPPPSDPSAWMMFTLIPYP
jgi:hypothetical protein